MRKLRVFIVNWQSQQIIKLYRITRLAAAMYRFSSLYEWLGYVCVCVCAGWPWYCDYINRENVVCFICSVIKPSVWCVIRALYSAVIICLTLNHADIQFDSIVRWYLRCLKIPPIFCLISSHADIPKQWNSMRIHSHWNITSRRSLFSSEYSPDKAIQLKCWFSIINLCLIQYSRQFWSIPWPVLIHFYSK